MTRIVIAFGFIFVLINLECCSGQTNNINVDQRSDMDDEFSQSINDFNNRVIHQNLTNEIIDSTADENLLQVVFDNLIIRLPRDYEKEYESIKSWNKSRQAIYLIWWLEAEVNNGGFNEFYFNTNGKYNNYLPEALELVGANKLAELTKAANKIYQAERAQTTSIRMEQ